MPRGLQEGRGEEEAARRGAGRELLGDEARIEEQPERDGEHRERPGQAVGISGGRGR
jgi:hypothetical protein